MATKLPPDTELLPVTDKSGDRTMADGNSFAPDEAELPGFGPPDSEMEQLAEQEMTPSEEDQTAERVARLQQLGQSLALKFSECEMKRQPIEDRWLEDLRQYHGRYDPSVLRSLTDSESCALFLNVTKPKTHAFAARVMDMVLPTDEKNWGIEPTPVPEMVEVSQQPEQQAVDPATGQPMVTPPVPGAPSGHPVLNKDMERGILDEAADRAEKMEDEIDDQLSECQYNAVQRKAIEQMSKLGTGVIMGPVVTDEWKTRWVPQPDATGKVQYVRQRVPNSDRRPAAQWVDVWNFYPDMSSPDPLSWAFAFVQYLVNPATLRKMGKQFNFMPEQLEQALAETPFNITTLRWMNELRDLSDTTNFVDRRHRLLRYYGEIGRDDLAAVGIDPESLGVTDNVFGTVWMVGNTVLKVDINPLDSGDLPFSVSYCDKDEASPFGTGIPRLMRGEQESINGAWRMKHDNAGLSVCPQTVMRMNAVTPADGDYHMKPKKLWYAADDVQRVADVFAQFSIDSHQAELDNILQLAIRFADDVTQLPLLMQGDMAPHITQTAQGMSLLYNASTVVLRRTVKFYDDYVTVPMLGRFYEWNMQFNPRDDIKGDMRIIARGSSTLLEKEQQGQALDTAMQFASTPVWAPYTDMEKLYAQALKSKRIQDVMLPPEKIAENLKAQAAAAQAQAQQGAQKAGGGAPAQDPQSMQAEIELKKRELDLKQYEIDSKERIAIANYAAQKDISLNDAQAAIAGIKIREDAANQRFSTELSMKARTGSGFEAGV